MRKLLWSWLALCPLVLEAEILEVRKVVAEGEGARKATHGVTGELVVLSDALLVGEKDVKDAQYTAGGGDQASHMVAVALTEEGGRRMAEGTKDGHGTLRLAFLVHGKVQVMPTVLAKASKFFLISGFKTKEEAEAYVVALKAARTAPAAEVK